MSFRAITLYGWIAFGLALRGSASAGPILSGSETYNSVTKLYTYSYTLDDRGDLGLQGPPSNRIDLLLRGMASQMPSSHNDPHPWAFSTSLTPGDGQAEWTWWNKNGVLPLGTKLSGFSFSSPIPPARVEYVILYDVGQDALPTKFGDVVGPAILKTPEPSSLVLGCLGSFGLFVVRRRRAKAIRL